VSRFESLAARLSALGLLCLLAVEVHSHGRLRFQRPSTVISNAYFPLRACEPFLLFLREVAKRVPNGYRVVVLTGENAVPGFGPLPSFLFGVSQLPRQNVVPEGAAAGPLPGRATWVACFGRSFADQRFVPVGSFLGGTLFRETQ
jgi:hypothetical protein